MTYLNNQNKTFPAKFEKSKQRHYINLRKIVCDEEEATLIYIGEGKSKKRKRSTCKIELPIDWNLALIDWKP